MSYLVEEYRLVGRCSQEDRFDQVQRFVLAMESDLRVWVQEWTGYRCQ